MIGRSSLSPDSDSAFFYYKLTASSEPGYEVFLRAVNQPFKPTAKTPIRNNR